MRRFVFSAPPTPPRRMTGDRACRSIGIGFHRGRCVAAIKRRKVLTESGKVDFELWSIDSTPSWHHQVRQVMGTAAARSGFCPRDRNILIRNYYDIEYETPNKRKKSGPAERSTTESGRGKTVPSKGGGGKTPSANARSTRSQSPKAGAAKAEAARAQATIGRPCGM